MLRAFPLSLAAFCLTIACSKPAPAPGGPAQIPATVQAAASQPAVKGKGESPADRGQRDDDGVVRRGETLSATRALPVSECIAQADALSGKSVKIEGTVSKVCTVKGCWFVVRDDESDQTIRITSKGYRFFVPSDAKGQRATLEGDLSVKTLSEEEAKHLVADSGGDPGTVTGPQKEVQIAAVSVEIRAAPAK
jgi:hypothetical protein